MFIAERHSTQRGRQYYSAQITQSYRDEQGRPRQRTLLDISSLGEEKIKAMKLALQGKQIVDWDSLQGLISALDFGIPYLTDKILRSLNFPYVLPDEGRKYYPTILAMVSNRLDTPFAKYSLHHWVEHTSLINYPDIDTKKAFHHETCYSALDFLQKNQRFIEEELYCQRESPPRLFLYDITSSYFEGRKAELAKYGYSRDHRKDRKQIVIGLVTDTQGLPICVEVLEGNTRDSTTVINKIDELKSRFSVEKACFIGDRGMKTEANVEHIKSEGFDFILALSHREVLKLADDDTPFQMSLFDVQNVAEVNVDGRRLIICKNPKAGEDTKRRRDELLKNTEDSLTKVKERINKGRLKHVDAIRKVIDKFFEKWKMEKFFKLTIGEGVLEFERDEEKIESASRLDGVYVIETSLEEKEMNSSEIQKSYKLLQVVERAFRSVKDVMEIRPVFHRKEIRIKGHVFICFLAYMVERILQLGIEDLMNEKEVEWVEIKEKLRNWREIKVQGRDDLQSLYSGIDDEMKEWLSKWNIPLPLRKAKKRQYRKNKKQ